MNAAERRGLLAILGFLSFSAVYSGVVMSPVLEQLAREFGITTGTAGLVVAAYGAPGIAVALLAGPYSDRIGRKPFLVIGPLVMGQDPLATERVWDMLYRSAVHGRKGVVMQALAGLDAALWDLLSDARASRWCGCAPRSPNDGRGCRYRLRSPVSPSLRKSPAP